MRGARLAGLALLGGVLLATMPIEPARPSYGPSWGRPRVMPFDTVEDVPEGAEATRVGWQAGQVTPTACPWWESDMRQPFEPVPWCMSAHHTGPGGHATETAGVADGSLYGYEQSYGPDGTPTFEPFGTVPPLAAAAWTAVAPTLEAERGEIRQEEEARQAPRRAEADRTRGQHALADLVGLGLLMIVSVSLAMQAARDLARSMKP